MKLVLAIDLGGTSLRAGLVDAQGGLHQMVAAQHRIGEEADAAAWWVTLRALIATLEPAGEVVGVGLSGFTRSQVLVDGAGQPVRPAQCFPDGRASAEAAALEGVEAGTWTAMSAWHPLARLRWVQAHDPAAFARAMRVLQPKDFLALCLTGQAAGDRVSNAWAFDRAGRLAEAPWRGAGLDPALLPGLLEPWERVGFWRGDVPVFAGAMDTWCATVGAGAVRDGGAYIVSGTTDAAGVFTRAAADVPGLVTLPWGTGLFHLGGPSQAGADCAAWAAALLGLDVPGLIDAAGQAEPGAPLLFLPYLTGERTPLWAPGARGVFLGLHRDHGAPQMARAVLEGVAFANRDLLSRAGVAFDQVVLCGGGSRSDAWCQIRADVLGVTVARSDVAEPGLVGAAACAWVGLGVFDGLAAAQAAMAGSRAAFQPDPARHARYDVLFEHFKRLQDVAVPLATALVSA